MASNELTALKNIGQAMAADLTLLGIDSIDALATKDADLLYLELGAITGTRPDPCVHDTFTAAIHQARTGEALPWWSFTPARKERQRQGTFV
jgi:nucleotidyltransferase/DNA polymerase involved in DNA repair